MPHDFKQFPELTNTQMQIYYFESPHKQITEDFRAKVIRVIDGDTIRLKCDFRNFEFPMRIIIIDAPELGEEGGLESKIWLKNKIEGQEVDILIDPNNKVEKWGRLLGDVMFGGESISEASLRESKSILFGFEKEGGIPEWDLVGVF